MDLKILADAIFQNSDKHLKDKLLRLTVSVDEMELGRVGTSPAPFKGSRWIARMRG